MNIRNANDIKIYMHTLATTNPARGRLIAHELTQVQRKTLKKILKTNGTLATTPEIKVLITKINSIEDDNQFSKKHKPLTHKLKNIFAGRISSNKLLAAAKKIEPAALSTRKAEKKEDRVIFNKKMQKHLIFLTGDASLIEKAPIFSSFAELEGILPEKVSSSVMKGVFLGAPFILLKVAIVDPEAYFKKNKQRFNEKMAKGAYESSKNSRPLDSIYAEYKEKELQHLKGLRCIIAIRQDPKEGVWTNLTKPGSGDAPAFYDGRSCLYSINEMPEELKAMPEFILSLVTKKPAIDGYGDAWKLTD